MFESGDPWISVFFPQLGKLNSYGRLEMKIRCSRNPASKIHILKEGAKISKFEVENF